MGGRTPYLVPTIGPLSIVYFFFYSISALSLPPPATPGVQNIVMYVLCKPLPRLNRSLWYLKYVVGSRSTVPHIDTSRTYSTSSHFPPVRLLPAVILTYEDTVFYIQSTCV